MTTLPAFRLRMAIGVLALVGLLVAVYLALYETRLSESLICPDQGCERVNLSDYVYMFGVPIAVIGVVGYGLILAITLGYINRRQMAGLPVGLVLLGLSGFGFLFSLFLTYLELFEIRAVCTWCVVSAGLMTAIFALAIAAWFGERPPRRARR
ncbi:MAG: vitamin K epoxide reductase family protein [Chloroflexia bacterium]